MDCHSERSRRAKFQLSENLCQSFKFDKGFIFAQTTVIARNEAIS